MHCNVHNSCTKDRNSEQLQRSSPDQIMERVEIQHPQHGLSSRNKEIDGSRVEMRREWNFLNKLFKLFFYVHLLLITVLIILLTCRGLLSAYQIRHFEPKKWYLLALSSTACAGILGYLWQTYTFFNPARALRVSFWLSPLLTCAFGVLLVSIGTAGSLAVSVIAIVSSILQALYACWVTPRFQQAIKVLAVAVAYHPPKVKATVILLLIASTLYSSFLMTGIGGARATRTEIDTLFVFIILVSFTWTMQIIKNMMQVMVSHVKYMQFACGIEIDFSSVVRITTRYSLGTVCIGSITVPLICVIHAVARAISWVSGDVDEFMFSCANCCSGVASRIIEYGNRWSFLHVGMYNKGIVQASKDTWEILRRSGMEQLIDSDLTSSFCFLCGTSAGSVCGLIAGTCALVIHKVYATEVTIFAFLIGYLINRVAMAWVQASVTAYYVAYAENPRSQQFDRTIPDYIRVLQRSQV